ncbi:PIG-L family deacetylase [Lacisediminihabitans sp.]|uniref:PIG-L family deacetylase n=1 Tax=Lacisediminihabitans sp. TaxID=2787631 RepID=UPI00374D7BD7
MVTFDAAEAGTGVEVWGDDPRLQSLPPLELTDVTALVVVAAHPDDETLGVGGLIALANDRRIPVTVIVATDGAASLAPELAVGLRRDRAAEIRSALQILNPSAHLVLLDLPDGQTPAHRERLRTLLRPALAGAAAGSLAVVPWRGDGHRDHRVVGEVAVDVATEVGLDFVEYPIWMWHWGTPEAEGIPWPRMTAVELSEAAVGRKRRAIDEFRSQVEPTADRPAMLRPDFLRHFRRPVEVLIDSRRASIGAGYFDDLYARRADPWRLSTRWYETRKRAITVASLPAPRYRHGLEIGCSIGTLTLELASRCDALLAVDLADGALDAARERLRGLRHVSFAKIDVTREFPPGQFDLIVVSEVGYYLSRRDLVDLFASVAAHLEPGGTVVLCHWRHPVSDYPLLGDEVHEIMRGTTTLTRTVRHDEADFLLELYSHDGASVAQREGLAP